MVIKQAELEAVCGITSKLPENAYPEVAFAGKSNVGKSSLINGLVNRKALARTSSQPGKDTDDQFLPDQSGRISGRSAGYGYAKVPQSEKEKWGKLIERYLHDSKQLKAVFLLIDIRHEPGKMMQSCMTGSVRMALRRSSSRQSSTRSSAARFRSRSN